MQHVIRVSNEANMASMPCHVKNNYVMILRYFDTEPITAVSFLLNNLGYCSALYIDVLVTVVRQNDIQVLLIIHAYESPAIETKHRAPVVLVWYAEVLC